METSDYKSIQINTNFREIDLNQECNELCKYFTSKFEELRGLEGARVTKSIFLTPIESQIIDEFCAENDTNLADLIRRTSWTDGAIPEALVIALHNEPQSAVKFTELGRNGFTYNYLKKYESWTKEKFDERFQEKGSTRPIRDRALVAEAVGNHIKDKFPTWSMYAKVGMMALGVFPENMKESIWEHFRIIDPNAVMTPQQLAKKKKRQEKDALKRKRGIANPKEKIKSVKINVSCLAQEQELLNNFINALKEAGLSLSMIAKYRLVQAGILDESMVRIPDEKKEACKNFKYTRPEPQGDYDWYLSEKKRLYGTERTVNNVSVTADARDIIFSHKKIGRGNFPRWMRTDVMDYYGVYPVVNGESIVDIYFSR